MKYMILLYGSQQDYDALTGKAAAGKPACEVQIPAVLVPDENPAPNENPVAGDLSGRRPLF